MSGERPACPRCGGEVAYDLTCHTYPQRRDDGTDAWMACLPCDSAIEYVCVRQYDDEPGDCDWTYTHGLNPRNPRSAANEANRPPWIPEGVNVMKSLGAPSWAPIVLATAVPGVRMLGDHDDSEVTP